jgi:hypothetical protein
LIIYIAFQKCSTAEKRKLLSVLGNPSASEAEITEVTNCCETGRD